MTCDLPGDISLDTEAEKSPLALTNSLPCSLKELIISIVIFLVSSCPSLSTDVMLIFSPGATVTKNRSNATKIC